MTDVIQDFIPQGRKNRPGGTNPDLYITIHNTGNSAKSAGAKNHADYLKGDTAANTPVSWHYTVDELCAYQHLPDNERAYHAGDGAGAGNTKSIGIEICMNGDLQKATDNAAGLTAELCRKHLIPAENVVQHNIWNGKDCPQMLRKGLPYTWEVFIGKVRGLTGASQTGSQESEQSTGLQQQVETDIKKPSAWAAEAWEWGKAQGITDGTNPQNPLTREQGVQLLYNYDKTRR